MLTARWIGLPVSEAARFQLDPGSLSILGFDHNLAEEPAIILWNVSAENLFDSVSNQRAGERRAIERWENEGGEIPTNTPEAAVAGVPSKVISDP